MTSVSIRSESTGSIGTASFMRVSTVGAVAVPGNREFSPYRAHPSRLRLDDRGGSVSGGGFGSRAREPSPRYEAVLHGEQGGGRSGRDADLPVRVLDVAIRGLDRDPQPPRHL